MTRRLSYHNPRSNAARRRRRGLGDDFSDSTVSDTGSDLQWIDFTDPGQSPPPVDEVVVTANAPQGTASPSDVLGPDLIVPSQQVNPIGPLDTTLPTAAQFATDPIQSAVSAAESIFHSLANKLTGKAPVGSSGGGGSAPSINIKISPTTPAATPQTPNSELLWLAAGGGILLLTLVISGGRHRR